jgi:hypothetical protein
MPPRLTRRRFLIAGLALVTGCGGGNSVFDERTPAPPGPTPSPRPSATASPTAVPTATPTPVPPTPVPPPMELRPPQIPQGGVTVAVLNQRATAATATFQGRQYPMLREEDRWWAVIGVGMRIEPGLYPVEISYTPADSTQAAGQVASLSITAHSLPVENIQLDPQTSTLLQPSIVNNEVAFRATIFAGFTAERLWDGPFVPPGSGVITSAYGIPRSYNGAPVSSWHFGTDFRGEVGTPVYAAAAGRVVFASELQVRGNTVMIDHGAGVFTAYHHLSAFNVAEGAEVTAGQQVGAIGATGLVTGPHLHWEVIVRGIEVNGENWLNGVEIGP